MVIFYRDKTCLRNTLSECWFVFGNDNVFLNFDFLIFFKKFSGLNIFLKLKVQIGRDEAGKINKRER